MKQMPSTVMGWMQGKAGQMRKIGTVVGVRRYEVEIGDSKYPVEQPTMMYVNAVDNREARKRIHEALRKDGWKREDYCILSVRLALQALLHTKVRTRHTRAAGRIYLVGSQ